MSGSFTDQRTGELVEYSSTVDNEGMDADLMRIGNHAISPDDFALMVWYWFTNRDLEEPYDVRTDSLERIRAAEIVEGRNPGRKRITLPNQ